jgi:ATP-dependent DNA helicase RecQ
LDDAVDGKIKFLYVSPERLKTRNFLERIKYMKVGLLAIDEAHCISKWGYDFRPAYLQINAFKALLTKVPTIALTATATLKVRNDITEKLELKKSNLFVQSFARNNLSYSVIVSEQKEIKLLQILKKVEGTAIVYAKTRNRTVEFSNFLKANGISSDYYHAGLSLKERNSRQEAWINNQTRVMVSTNAFGMGIDKPDVRCVVHVDLCDNLEAYYQESGRAGRDSLKAYAVALYNENDLEKAIYEEIEKIKTEGITEKELQKIKNQKLMEFYGQIETINGKSNNIGTYEVFFGDYKKMFDAPAAFNKVTVDDIKNVAKKYFKKTTRTVGILKANTEE